MHQTLFSGRIYCGYIHCAVFYLQKSFRSRQSSSSCMYAHDCIRVYMSVFVCACVRACARTCVRVCVHGHVYEY